MKEPNHIIIYYIIHYKIMVTSTTRRKIIAIILTILIWGLGHAYLQRIKRGVALFFLGLGIMIVVSFLIIEKQCNSAKSSYKMHILDYEYNDNIVS